MSQKSYMWNGNNPMSYTDPSGYSFTYTGQSGNAGAQLYNDALFVSQNGSGTVGFMSIGGSLSDVIIDTAKKAAKLPQNREYGASIYCLFGSSGCFAGSLRQSEICQPGSDCSVSPVTDLGASTRSFFRGFWHSHPPGAEPDSISGHLEQAKTIAKNLGINARSNPVYIWTTLGHDIQTQIFSGSVNSPAYGLIQNVCTNCIP